MAAALRIPSPWIDDLEAPTRALEGHVDADVIIIGGGYAGLSSALALAAEGRRVVVLEASVCGFGASGRNAGHLTPTIGKDLPTLLLLFGLEGSRRLVSFAETALAHAESLIDRLGIDCDYRRVGNVLASVHPSQESVIDALADAAGRLGVAGRRLSTGDARALDLPAAFGAGYLEEHGGILNPAKLVRGLRRAAIEAGVRVLEQSPVRRVDPGRVLTAHAAGGRVRAPHLVVATNAWTGDLGLPVPDVARIHVQLFRTAPLSPTQRSAVGWSGEQGIYTAHEILESWRLDADGRIVGGSKLIRYGYGNRTLPDVDAGVAALLERAFRERFPELRDLPIERHWGGPTAFSLDFLPRVGRATRAENVVYAIGWAGHGVAQATYAGRMVSDLLAGRDGPGSAIWDRRLLVPLPPEPLRYGVASALTSLFAWLDRRVDRRIARAALVALLVCILTVATGCTAPPRVRKFFDPIEHLTAPPVFPIPRDLSVGRWAETTTTLDDGTSSTRRVAAVGRDPQRRWQIELTDSADDHALALLVRSNGTVVHAWAGRPGGALREVPLAPRSLAASPRRPPPLEDEVIDTITTGAGRLRCRKESAVATGVAAVSWIGLDGDARGVLVRTTGPTGGGHELASLKRRSLEVEVDGASYPCLVAAYDNGAERWVAERPPPLAGEVLRLVDPAVLTLALTGAGDDARPTLTWPDPSDASSGNVAAADTPTPRVARDHVHDSHCGHAYSGSAWAYLEKHIHRRGCGHHLYDGAWWTEPPHVPVALPRGHVCDHGCGHAYWRGRLVYRHGHVHRRGCGHRFTAGAWIRFRGTP